MRFRVTSRGTTDDIWGSNRHSINPLLPRFHCSSSNPTAAAAMDAIKKKMQAMKLEKDNAMDRADACEQQAKDANLRAERVSK